MNRQTGKEIHFKLLYIYQQLKADDTVYFSTIDNNIMYGIFSAYKLLDMQYVFCTLI